MGPYSPWGSADTHDPESTSTPAARRESAAPSAGRSYPARSLRPDASRPPATRTPHSAVHRPPPHTPRDMPVDPQSIRSDSADLAPPYLTPPTRFAPTPGS